MSTNYKLREEIELVSLPDGAGIISDPSNKKCHNLNATGVLICQHMTMHKIIAAEKNVDR